ncbi:MAG: UDP-N-acetylmuramoyl-tripeptide--D-alanyl-D-alanine ligase [Eubacteriales bacterium]|nr:UDP-N-acetylmuramoyl-tripeptide--D-alanyl-D-alanine ligase [Eubacteriales bacterium]
MSIFIMVIFVVWLINAYDRILYSLHMMQLEMYENDKYMNWLTNNKTKAHGPKASILVIASVVLALFYMFYQYDLTILVLVWSAIGLYVASFRKYESKKPLVMTDRAKRLLIGTLTLAIVDFIVVVLLVRLIAGETYYIPISAFILSLSIYYGTYYIIGGVWLLNPVEKSINSKFYNLAQDKVKSFEDLTVVGITGSYGKTSTKFITAEILEQKFKTFKTPGSYNTPMGVSKVINEELDSTYNVFVAELGAERMGEIKEMTKLVKPDIGIITSIGPCHLETFKTIENIAKTKYELIEGLSGDGWAIFNYDNDYVKKLADMTYIKKILYGLNNTKDLDVYAEDIVTGIEGSTFNLIIKDKGTVVCKTKLLGKHNVLNILAGAATGYALGMSLVQIASGIERIEPIQHRLQLINPGTGVIVIDDAFNSNPDGAAAALEVLSEFQDHRKVIVTPGMIGLGDLEYEENKKLGQGIAKVCDIAILVGEVKTKAIKDGLVEAGFIRENIIIVKSLKESENVLRTLLKKGDVVLFENDLPDTYNEA